MLQLWYNLFFPFVFGVFVSLPTSSSQDITVKLIENILAKISGKKYICQQWPIELASSFSRTCPKQNVLNSSRMLGMRIIIANFHMFFCWMAPWKLLPPNLHPPHFPQQITPFPRHFQRHHWHPLTLLPSPPSLSGARTCGRSHRSRHPSDDLGSSWFGRSPGGDFG